MMVVVVVVVNDNECVGCRKKLQDHRVEDINNTEICGIAPKEKSGAGVTSGNLLFKCVVEKFSFKVLSEQRN